MNTELLSVVNEKDEAIDTLPRDVIHASGLKHRAVHILIFNDRGELFLQKRSIKKDLNKGLWDTSVGGHVDKAEDYTDAAIREAEEELGIDITSSLTPVFKLSPSEQLGMEFIQVFKSKQEGPFTLNAAEIEQGNWFSVNEISNRVYNDDPILTETFKTIWRKYNQG